MGDTVVRAGSEVVTPQQFIDALTDSGDRRPKIWALNDTDFFKLHDRGDDWADVTEGTHMFFGDIWQRYRYDWSRPGVVRLDVSQSNLFGEGSWWQYDVTPTNDKGCNVTLKIHRQPCSTKGRLLDLGMNPMAGILLKRDLKKTFEALAL